MLTIRIFCNIITKESRRGLSLGFKLRQDKKETENKTIRFPSPLIERIEEAIQGKNVSFSSFVIQACEYALRDMDHSKE